ncbi:MAG: hypothetical protein FJY82_12680 [Candidatus Aminicenantes bacterium]|nr:hypothetical protein [Candidatus Aminicenantes bacterium]
MVSKAVMNSLARMLYPGRFIVIGSDPSGSVDVVVYGLTGRSPSSRSRRLERRGGAVWTEPADPETVKRGNVDLLLYPAVVLGAGIAASNGRQTTDIDLSAGENPVAVLAAGLERWTYEPDAPNHTPRIAGCVLPNGRSALGVIRRGRGGSAERAFFECPAVPGRGRLIATYTGENSDPLPAFRGEPLEVEIATGTPEETAAAVFAALRPEGRVEDFRVAVACVFWPREAGLRPQVAIVNRHERTPS